MHKILVVICLLGFTISLYGQSNSKELANTTSLDITVVMDKYFNVWITTMGRGLNKFKYGNIQ